MTVTWDGTFEGLPADIDERKYGANKIRQLKVAISEREELEHNFKAGSQPFHRAGKCSVVYVGTTASISGLTGMSEGSLAWDTDLKVWEVYTSSAWAVRDFDHGALSGKSDDDHPQYLKLNKAGQTLSENLAVAAGITIDGVDISVHALGSALAQHVGAEGGLLSLVDVFLTYNSGWQAAVANTTYELTHGLGVIPTLVIVQIADSASPATTWQTLQPSYRGTSDLGAMVKMDSTKLYVRTGDKAIYDCIAAAYKNWAYMRVIAFV
jgi:hypothetical protein